MKQTAKIEIGQFPESFDAIESAAIGRKYL
jgi:hypothetical protein